MNTFNWNTGEPTIFAKDPTFTPKGKNGMSNSDIASHSRELSENSGKNVATIGGIGKIVIDTLYSKNFHVHRKDAK